MTLGQEMIDQLVDRLSRRTRRLARGETLFQQNAPADAFFAIRRGTVLLERSTEGGGLLTLHVASAPATLAEAALFANRYHCRGVSETDAIVEVIDKDAALEALAADSGLALLFLEHLAAQVRDLRARLELREIRRAKDRLVALLRLQPKRLSNNIRPLASIAREIGLTPESLYRAVSALEKQGRLERSERRLRLIDASSSGRASRP